KRQSPYQLPQSHAHASPENMACPSQPPCRFDTKVESQIQYSEKPADSVNPENALIPRPQKDDSFLDSQSRTSQIQALANDGGSPWQEQLRCGMILTPPRCGSWPRIRKMAHRSGGYCRWLQSTT